MLGKQILAGFNTNLAGLKGVRQIRGLGLMIGIELDRDCTGLVAAGLQQNILINVTADKVIRLLPPLIISEDEADRIVATVTGLVREFLQG